MKSVANLRTIIVIADIHQGLHKSPVHIATYQRSWLTFWHWSSVPPYTSSYEFAGSCVFGKQSPGILSLRPSCEGRPYSEGTAAFLPSSLEHTHSFALLYSSCTPVSVCGTVVNMMCLEVFLGRLFAIVLFGRSLKYPTLAIAALKQHAGFVWHTYLKVQTSIQ